MSSTFYNYQNPLNVCASFLMAINSTFGSVCNSLIIYIFVKEKDRSSFNLMCLFRASINLYILVTSFSLLFIPVTLLGSNVFSPIYETINIVLTKSLYLVNEYQTILVASNRFIAMYFPIYYDKLCGFKSTLVILILIFLNRFIIACRENYAVIEIDCLTTFSSEWLTWFPSFERRCEFQSDDLMNFTYVTFGSICIVNSLTLFKIIRYYMTSNENNGVSKKRVRKNIGLYFQTVLQDSLYLIDLTFTFKLNTLSDTRLWSFISGTFIWQCLHSFDGFIMIMFNGRLQFIKNSIFTKTSKVQPGNRTASILPSIS